MFVTGRFNKTERHREFVGCICNGNLWWRWSNRQCPRIYWLVEGQWCRTAGLAICSKLLIVLHCYLLTWISNSLHTVHDNSGLPFQYSALRFSFLKITVSVLSCRYCFSALSLLLTHFNDDEVFISFSSTLEVKTWRLSLIVHWSTLC